MTKQQLKAYSKMETELKSLQDHIKSLEEQITSPMLARLSDMPKGGKKYDIADKIALLADEKAIYLKKWDELLFIRRCVEKEIDALSDPVERALMRYKYIEGLTWEEVCEKINYSWRQAHRIHTRAIKKLEEGRKRAEEKTGGRS